MEAQDEANPEEPQGNPVNPDEVRLRPGVEGDLRLVRHTWRFSYSVATLSPNSRSPDLETYIRAQKQVIDTALASSSLLVACDPEHEWQILGWVCHRGPVLHYVYVKERYRGRGIARALLGNSVAGQPKVYVTHTTRHLDNLRRCLGRVVFNPSLIFG